MESNEHVSSRLFKKVDVLIFKFLISLGDTVLGGVSLTK